MTVIKTGNLSMMMRVGKSGLKGTQTCWSYLGLDINESIWVLSWEYNSWARTLEADDLVVMTEPDTMLIMITQITVSKGKRVVVAILMKEHLLIRRAE
jgi:hypothetical protein